MSKFGIAINVFTNKIIGVDVRSKYCQMCKGKGNCKYGDKCVTNYAGSSGGMEPEGVCDIIFALKDKFDLRVTKFLGDGDSRGFAKAKSSIDWPLFSSKDANTCLLATILSLCKLLLIF